MYTIHYTVYSIHYTVYITNNYIIYTTVYTFVHITCIHCQIKLNRTLLYRIFIYVMIDENEL